VLSDVSVGLRDCASRDIVGAVAIELPAPLAGVDRESDYERTAVVGRALADPKRLCVLESLAVGELSVSELAGRVACQVPNMSQHLAVLRAAGLVATRREGSTVFYRLADPRVIEAYKLLQSIAR
jgi:DNA-binding transcriptional ArsR family regulator